MDSVRGAVRSHARIFDLHTHMAKIQCAAISVVDFDLHIVGLGLDCLVTDEDLESSDLRFGAVEGIRLGFAVDDNVANLDADGRCR